MTPRQVKGEEKGEEMVDRQKGKKGEEGKTNY